VKMTSLLQNGCDLKLLRLSLLSQSKRILNPSNSWAMAQPVKWKSRGGSLKSPRSSAESANFVFGENLTERADNFQSVKAANFVFGQNLTERAENFSPEPRDEETTGSSSASKAAAETPALPVQTTSDPKSPPKSLTESAAAYYESHAPPKRKYDEVKNHFSLTVLILISETSIFNFW